MTHVKSSAGAALVDYYLSEGCAHLAIQLHRLRRLPLAILWDNELLDDWGRGPEPSPVHVFVTDPATSAALDITGWRSVAEMLEHYYDLVDPETDYSVSETEVRSLMGDDRPLCASTPEEELEALRAIQASGLLTLLPPAGLR
jgi:hypothetical protein